MFKGSIFDNTGTYIQKSSFEYISILLPLNISTELTISIYEKVAKLMG